MRTLVRLFVVVPLLFRHLDTPAQAGRMAAQLFSAQTWVSAGCAMLLLLLTQKNDSSARRPGMHHATAWTVAGLLLALLVEFGVAAQIVTARASAGNLRLWHAVGSVMYLGQWLCAARVFWLLATPRRNPPPHA